MFRRPKNLSWVGVENRKRKAAFADLINTSDPNPCTRHVSSPQDKEPD